MRPALEYIRSHDSRMPKIGVILGSGLGGLIDAAADTVYFPASELPGYPESTVKGHEGGLVIGTIGGRVAAFVRGRPHLYEGYTIDEVTLPVRIFHELGVERLVITNAAGGINPNFVPGSLMFIADHITLGKIEISAACRNIDPRRYGREVYDTRWLKRARQAARKLQLHSEVGVYVWTRGPSYETPAEVRAFALAGADAVGMSTVPEAVQAHTLHMKVLGVSMITNRAAGLHAGPLTHDEVLDRVTRMHGSLTHLVRRIIGLEYAV